MSRRERRIQLLTEKKEQEKAKELEKQKEREKYEFYLDVFKRVKDNFVRNFTSEMPNLFKFIQQKPNLPPDIVTATCNLAQEAMKETSQPDAVVFWRTLQLHLGCHEEEAILRLLSLTKRMFDRRVKWFFFFNLSRTFFFIYQKLDVDTREEIIVSLQEIFTDISTYYTAPLLTKFKPKEDRLQSNRIVVLTNQILNTETHAPTAFLLWRAKALNDLGFEVTIVCTCEQPRQSIYAYVNCMVGAFVPEFYSRQEYVYDGVSFPFIYASKPMPDPVAIEELAQKIYDLNPRAVVQINGSSFVSDVCSSFVPVLSFATTSFLPFGDPTYLVMFHPRGEREERENGYLKQIGRDPKTFLFHPPFVPPLPQKKATFTREQFGIPKDAVVVLIVGNRLYNEIDDTFLEMLQEWLENRPNLLYLFVGNYPTYKTALQPYPLLKNRTRHVDTTPYLYDIYDLADIYLNPKRIGGGLTGLWAVLRKMPFISLNFGDAVGILKGHEKEFLFETWEDAAKEVERLCDDPAYRKERAEKAYETTLLLSSLPDVMKGILTEAGVL